MKIIILYYIFLNIVYVNFPIIILKIMFLFKIIKEILVNELNN